MDRKIIIRKAREIVEDRNLNQFQRCADRQENWRKIAEKIDVRILDAI